MSRGPLVPRSIAFELTPRCDQRCAYCYNVWKGEGAASYPTAEPLSTAELCSLLSRVVAESGCRDLCLTGGEPLLRDGALELVAHAAAQGGQVVLITNGAHVTPAVADALAAHPRLAVQLTFLAVDRALHDGIRGRPNFDAAVDALATLRERGVAVTLCFVATRLNSEALRGVLDLCYGAGVRDVVLNRMAPAGQGAEQQAALAPTVEQLEGCLAVADELAAQYGLVVTTGIPIPPCLVAPERYPHVRFTTCSSASAQPNLVVDYQGQLRSCNLSPVRLADLRQQSWRQAARAAVAYLERFARALPVVCRGCVFAASCRGGCKEAAHACYGSLEVEEPLLRQGVQAARWRVAG